LDGKTLLIEERDFKYSEDEDSKSPHERGSWRFRGGGIAPGESERFCDAVCDDEEREALSVSRLATPSWMAFLRASESALRLGAGGTEAGGVSVILFEEKSRLTVARPERGCRSRCIISSDDERNEDALSAADRVVSECPIHRLGEYANDHVDALYH